MSAGVAVADRRRAAWRFIGSLLVRERRGVALAAISGLSWQAAAILTPIIAAQAIDAVIEGNRGDVYLWAGVAVAVALVEAAAGAGRHVYAMRNRARGLAHVRDDLLTQALRLDARFHDRFPPGELMSRSSSDAEVVSRVLDASGHTVGYLVTVVGASIVLLLIDWTLALLILAPLPLLIVGFWRYARRYSSRTKAYQEELGHASALVEETVAGIRVVKGLGAGAALSQRFHDSSERVRARALDVVSVDAVFLPALDVVPLLDQVLVLWFGGQRVLDGQLTLGEFVAFNAYVVLLVWPLRVLGQRISTVQNALAAAERIVEALEQEPAVRDPARPLSLDPAPHGADVRFAGVRFGFDESSPVLDGFDLHVEPGASSRSSAARAAGRARSRRCSRASTTCRRAPSLSTAWTSASSRSESSARRSRSSPRRRTSSPRPCARTSRSGGTARRTPRSRPPRGPQARTSSSRSSRTGTTRCSASAATRSRAASASASRSRARSSPIPTSSSSTTPPRRSTRRSSATTGSNRVFKGYDDIVAHCCAAWNDLIDQPWRIRLIGSRTWAEGF